MGKTLNTTATKDNRKSFINSVQEFQYEHGKIPPQAVELEEVVLGEMLLEKDALSNVIELLNEDVFYKDSHKIIFQAIHDLFHSNSPVDVLTVTEKLRKMGKLEEVGGAYFITQLTARVSSSANIEYHVGIIKQKLLQRALISISNETIKKAFEDTTDVFDLLDETEQKIFEISEVNLKKKVQNVKTILANVMSNISNMRTSEGDTTGLLTNFGVLDNITGGWQPSDLIIIAARPGMGKTSFVLSMARNIAIDYNKPVAIFSLEMTSSQLVSRLLASEAEVSSEKLRTGKMQNYEWEQINSKLQVLADAPIFIDDTPGLSLFELRAKARRLKAQHDIKAIIIDYIQLMTDSDRKGAGNREQEIATISRSLKGLAKELDIPVIALSQLNRSVETRGGTGQGSKDKKPVLSDLRESGAIEQDADLVLFIYRPEYYKIYEDDYGNDTRGKAMISIAKHRNGKTDEVWLQFIHEFTRFQNLPSDLSLDSYNFVPNNDFENQTIDSIVLPSKINAQSKDDEMENPDF